MPPPPAGFHPPRNSLPSPQTQQQQPKQQKQQCLTVKVPPEAVPGSTVTFAWEGKKFRATVPSDFSGGDDLRVHISTEVNAATGAAAGAAAGTPESMHEKEGGLPR